MGICTPLSDLVVFWELFGSLWGVAECGSSWEMGQSDPGHDKLGSSPKSALRLVLNAYRLLNIDICTIY